MLPWLIGGAIALGAAAISAFSSNDDDDDEKEQRKRREARRRAREAHNERIMDEIGEYVDEELGSVVKSIENLEKQHGTKLGWQWHTREEEPLSKSSDNLTEVQEVLHAYLGDLSNSENLAAFFERFPKEWHKIYQNGCLPKISSGSKYDIRQEFLKGGELSKKVMDELAREKQANEEEGEDKEEEEFDFNKLFPRFVGLDTTLLKLEEVYLGKEIAKLKELQNAIK